MTIDHAAPATHQLGTILCRYGRACERSGLCGPVQSDRAPTKVRVLPSSPWRCVEGQEVEGGRTTVDNCASYPARGSWVNEPRTLATLPHCSGAVGGEPAAEAARVRVPHVQEPAELHPGRQRRAAHPRPGHHERPAHPAVGAAPGPDEGAGVDGEEFLSSYEDDKGSVVVSLGTHAKQWVMTDKP